MTPRYQMYSGVKPKRRISGSPARKSPITQRAIRACTMAKAPEPSGPECCAQHLVQVDGRGVSRHHLAGVGPNQARNLVAQALGLLKPARLVSRADQADAPFLGDHLCHACSSGFWQCAQGVAVQVDQTLRQAELVSQVAQWVLSVTLLAVFQCCHRKLGCCVVGAWCKYTSTDVHWATSRVTSGRL